MAELFTEEDVPKPPGDLLDACPTQFERDRLGMVWRTGYAAALSALAEDGRLSSTANWCVEHEQWLPECPPTGTHRVVQRPSPAESGGALPSDTPALAVEHEYRVTGYGIDGEDDSDERWYSGTTDKRERAEEHVDWARRRGCRDVRLERQTRHVGPWEPVTDPVSVLEEETLERE